MSNGMWIQLYLMRQIAGIRKPIRLIVHSENGDNPRIIELLTWRQPGDLEVMQADYQRRAGL